MLQSSILVSGQEQNNIEEILKALEEEALEINIVARILSPNDKPVVNAVSSKLTIPGRPVVVRIKGRNIFISATLTPYLPENGKLILVAQGQVWFSESAEEQPVKYHSSMKSIPITMGEKIFFFPLGVAQDFAASNQFNIALEIEIVPFKGW